MIKDVFKRSLSLFSAGLIVCTFVITSGLCSFDVAALDSGDLADPPVSGEALSSGGSSVSGDEKVNAGSSRDSEIVDFFGDGVITADSLEVNASQVILAEEQQLDDFPSGAGMQSGVFMEVDTDVFGQITIWIPSNFQYRSFALNDNGIPVNITSSTITGYYYGGQDYSVRWSSFGQAAYRPVDSSGYTWNDLEIVDVINTNIAMGQQQYLLLPGTDMLLYILIFLLGAIAIWICTR